MWYRVKKKEVTWSELEEAGLCNPVGPRGFSKLGKKLANLIASK